MPKFEALSISSYKAFAGDEELPLAPLTVVFGANGSGKSALCRLPIGVSAALHADSKAPPGLPLRVGELSFGESFASLRHGTGSPEFDIGLALSSPDGVIDLAVTIEQAAGTRASHPRQQVKRWAMTVGDSTRVLQRAEGDGMYTLDGGTPQFVRFTGLLPRPASDGRFPWIQPLLSTPPVLHLAAARDGARSAFGEHRFDAALDVGSDGAGCADVLGTLYAARADTTLDAINAALRAVLDVEIDVKELSTGPLTRFVPMGRRCNRSTWVPLNELGTGVARALPVVIQHVLASTGQLGFASPGLIITEEPEAHLHPQAQAALADVILDAARAGQWRCLVETHSETFVLRVRRRVAEGLDPSMVAFAWVDEEGSVTRLRRLDFRADGSIPDWPENWFGCAMDEVRAIHRARRG